VRSIRIESDRETRQLGQMNRDREERENRKIRWRIQIGESVSVSVNR
jgi:hypothetical protein